MRTRSIPRTRGLDDRSPLRRPRPLTNRPAIPTEPGATSRGACVAGRTRIAPETSTRPVDPAGANSVLEWASDGDGAGSRSCRRPPWSPASARSSAAAPGRSPILPLRPMQRNALRRVFDRKPAVGIGALSRCYAARTFISRGGDHRLARPASPWSDVRCFRPAARAGPSGRTRRVFDRLGRPVARTSIEAAGSLSDPPAAPPIAVRGGQRSCLLRVRSRTHGCGRGASDVFLPAASAIGRSRWPTFAPHTGAVADSRVRSRSLGRFPPCRKCHGRVVVANVRAARW